MKQAPQSTANYQMSAKSVTRLGSYEHLKVRPIHLDLYIVRNTSSLISEPNSMIIGAITQSYDAPPPPPPKLMVQKSPCQIGLRGYIYIYRIGKIRYTYRIGKMSITCTIFICQSICVKIPDWTFVICAVSLSCMKKN